MTLEQEARLTVAKAHIEAAQIILRNTVTPRDVDIAADNIRAANCILLAVQEELHRENPINPTAGYTNFSGKI